MKRKIKQAAVIEPTLQSAFEEFVEEKEALNKSAATIISYRGSMKVWFDFLEASGRSMLVKDVNASYVYAFCQHSLNEEMKPTSLNHYVRDIRAFLYWCRDNKGMADFKVKLVQEQEVVKETYTEEELMRMLERPKNNASFVEWRTWAVVNWILATGNRAGTVVEVVLGDVDFKNREIQINHTKNNRAIMLPLSSALANCLNEYIKRWRADSQPYDYLFPNVGDEALTVNALKLSLRAYNKSREVDRTSIHALRHTFAKEYIRRTGNMAKLQKILGHRSMEMTRRYVNLFVEDLKEDFDRDSPLDNLRKKYNRTQKVKRSE